MKYCDTKLNGPFSSQPQTENDTHKRPQLGQDVGHGGVGLVVLLRLGERPPRRVDEPRCDDGEHVELLAGVGRQVRTGDEVMPGGGGQNEELEQDKAQQTKQRKGRFSQFHCVCPERCVTNKSLHSLNTIFSRSINCPLDIISLSACDSHEN